MNDKMIEKLVGEYYVKRELYEDFAMNMAGLLRLLLNSENIRFQEVAYRAKTIERLREKIRRKYQKGKTYRSLDDISDLAGIRVILYFKDDIDKIIEMVEKECKVFKSEGLDKEKESIKQPDRFGYFAKHLVISLDSIRRKMPEYKRFSGLKCELQTRTVLQHAWAEIEHDIGYKPETNGTETENAELRRLFSENAALLEVADDKFVEIRKKFIGHHKIKKADSIRFG